MNKITIVLVSLCCIPVMCYASPVQAPGNPVAPIAPITTPAPVAPVNPPSASTEDATNLKEAQRNVKEAAQALASEINNLKHEAETIGSQQRRHISR